MKTRKDKAIVPTERDANEVKHTPTPWEVNGFSIRPTKSGEPYIVIPSPQRHDAEEIQANAAFIVRAVNSHEDYKEVAMYARALLKALEPRFMRTGCSDTEEVAVKCLREAIAKAEGK